MLFHSDVFAWAGKLMSESTTRPPVYRINNDLSAAIVDREIAGAPKTCQYSSARYLEIDPTKMTAPEIAEIIRFNTRNVVSASGNGYNFSDGFSQRKSTTRFAFLGTFINGDSTKISRSSRYAFNPATLN